MMTREVGYYGFGTAPLLSNSLFADHFILSKYNPLDSFFFVSGGSVTGQLLKRFNSAAERSFTTLIETGDTVHSQAAFSIQSFYRSIFMYAYKFQQTDRADDHGVTFEMLMAVRLARKMANTLLASKRQAEYGALYVSNVGHYRGDVLETLVEIVYEALCGISNRFSGVEDPFWILAIGVMHDIFDSVGTVPDGMTPFQQRLTLKIVDKLDDNVRGFYPAICKVLLSTVGPYNQPNAQTNRTAFNILKDAMYIVLRRLRRLDQNKISSYLPPHVTYDPTTTRLIFTYRGGAQVFTDMSALRVPAFSLTSSRIRRDLTNAERRAAAENWR
jgi:hypothetical protein